MTRWETARYTQLLPNGKAEQFQLRMDTNSVIMSPSGMMNIRPGYNRITGLAWSGHGKIAKVEVSTDAGTTWKAAELNNPVPGPICSGGSRRTHSFLVRRNFRMVPI